MRRAYQVLGGVLLLAYLAVELKGWELPGRAQRSVVPQSARSVGGYRTYHYWNGGK